MFCPLGHDCNIRIIVALVLKRFAREICEKMNIQGRKKTLPPGGYCSREDGFQLGRPMNRRYIRPRLWRRQRCRSRTSNPSISRMLLIMAMSPFIGTGLDHSGEWHRTSPSHCDGVLPKLILKHRYSPRTLWTWSTWSTLSIQDGLALINSERLSWTV